MAGTRTSPRQAAKASDQATENTNSTNNAGSKRKADSVTGSSPTNKRGKKDIEKGQKTLEETLPEEDHDTEMKESEKTADNGPRDAEQEEKHEVDSTDLNGHTNDSEARVDDSKEAQITRKADQATESEEAGDGAVQAKDDPAPSMSKENESTAPATKENGAIEVNGKCKLPPTILEKGIIYFFTRGRVGIEDPKSVPDLQRSFFVLRPLPSGAKLGDGAIQDLENNRLIAIPKKVLPKSHRDRFMVFVEKGKTTIADLKENFFQGSEYETKTSGVRSTPPVTLVGEGVYALTTEARNTHLAYMLTIPSELGEIQEDMGIRAKGSFLLSLKNPTVSGPANASLPQGPDFPEEIIEEFRGRAWMPPSDPKQLDYPNAQFLLIGEGEEGFDKALETAADGKGKDEAAKQDVEELEHQDEIRVEHLHGDHTVFDDLDISKKDYSLATTW